MSCSTFEAWVWPPSTDCWKNVYWPAAELRPIGSIVVDRFDPDTWFQLVSMPRKMFFSDVSEMLLIALALLTPMQSAVEKQLLVRRARVARLGRTRVDRELDATGLHVLDAGVAAVGDVLEVDVLVERVVAP